MLNLLKEYIPHSMPDRGQFVTNPGLVQKVASDGGLLAFLGNTAVLTLDSKTKEELKELQAELYQAASDMLAEPLREDTFHMTLHDLANGVPGQWGLEEDMADMAGKASPILSFCRKLMPIRMRATWMFNMVNTSIVLGMEPVNEEDGWKLDEMYNALELVRPLGYALTPHITLAYFKPGCYGEDDVARLRAALHSVNLEVMLWPEQLVLQKFWTMNHYETILEK